MLNLFIGFVLGAITAGFIVLNNKNKALALLQAAKEVVEAELARLKTSA